MRQEGGSDIGIAPAGASDSEDLLRLDRQICFPLYAASNLLTRLYRPLLARLGLTYPQYLAMLVLWEHSPQCVGDLAARLHLDSATLTPLLKRLEQAGFVDRRRDKTDERRVLVTLTDAGRALKRPASSVPATLGTGLNLQRADVEALRQSVQHMIGILLSHPPSTTDNIVHPNIEGTATMADKLPNIPLTRIDGESTDLEAFAGKVLLVVNVASKCGLTPQYAGLESLYESKRDQGLEILGFPANNFRDQEPGTDSEIATFCSATYNVQFPIFSKISVKGEDQHPLYRELTSAGLPAVGEGPMRERLKGFGIESGPESEVLWNFEKFLIGKDGTPVGRFAPDVAVDDPRLVAAIDDALAA